MRGILAQQSEPVVRLSSRGAQTPGDPASCGRYSAPLECSERACIFLLQRLCRLLGNICEVPRRLRGGGMTDRSAVSPRITTGR
jgi:hypothetical protein